MRNSKGIQAEPLELNLAAPGAGLRLAQEVRERNLRIDLWSTCGFGEGGKFWTSPREQLEMIHLHNTQL